MVIVSACRTAIGKCGGRFRGLGVLENPVGCTGTRIMTTLLYEMEKRDAKRGLATLCAGGGHGNRRDPSKIIGAVLTRTCRASHGPTQR